MLRRIFLAVSVFVFLLLVTLVALPFVVDINRYKADLMQLLEARTGYKVDIAGEIGFSVLPDLALKLEGVTVSGAMEKPFLKVQKMKTTLRLRPLLNRDVEIADLDFVAPELYVHRDSKGELNLLKKRPLSVSKDEAAGQSVSEENDVEETEVSETVVETPDEEVASVGRSFRIESIIVKNAALTYQDDQRSVTYKIDALDAQTSLGSGSNPFSVKGKIVPLSKRYANFSLQGDYVFSDSLIDVQNVVLKLGETSVDASFNMKRNMQRPQIKTGFYVQGGSLSLYADYYNYGVDAFKTAFQGGDAMAQSQGQQGVAEIVKSPKINSAKKSDAVLPFEQLRRVNLHFGLNVNDTSFRGITLNKLVFHAHIKDGKLTAKVKEAKLFGGDISGETIIDGQVENPGISKIFEFNGLDVAQLASVAGKPGAANGKLGGKINIASSGRTQDALRRNLSGSANVALDEGSFKGLDLLALASNLVGALKDGASGQGTAFSTLTASFNINQGQVSNNDLVIKAPLFEFSGRGTADLVAERVDYLLTPVVGKKLVGNAGIGIKFPIRITGKFANLNIRPDIEATVIENLLPGEDGTSANPVGIVKGIADELLGKKKGGENLQKGLEELFKAF